MAPDVRQVVVDTELAHVPRLVSVLARHEARHVHHRGRFAGLPARGAAVDLLVCELGAAAQGEVLDVGGRDQRGHAACQGQGQSLQHLQRARGKYFIILINHSNVINLPSLSVLLDFYKYFYVFV